MQQVPTNHAQTQRFTSLAPQHLLRSTLRTTMQQIFYLFLILLLHDASLLATDRSTTDGSEFASTIRPLLNSYCIKCHGPATVKGELAMHILGDLQDGRDIEQWEKILNKLESGEMPPEGEAQPNPVEKRDFITWIDNALRMYVAKTEDSAITPTTRRLTNFEYNNTMRDLLGFELNLIKNLPKDPIKPYVFNNTAEFMRIGPEQMDRYKENARRAMASAIVNPSDPEIHKTRREWEPRGGSPTEIQFDELQGRRGSPGGGMGIKSWPETGEFRIRIKSAAIMPKGVTQVPLSLVMGSNINENSSTLLVEPVGTVAVTQNIDNPQVFEFRGRIENFPPRVITANGKVSYRLTVTPQNLYDDGRLNDNLNRLARPRLVVKWIDFEAPVFETWPPPYHTTILFDSPLRKSDPNAYVRAVLERFMIRAFRRPVHQDEVDTYVKIYEIVSLDLPTIEEAMRETLAMVLISPDFLYHSVPKARDQNSQYELASKLSYFLWGSMPDETLFRLAKTGKLTETTVIDQQVRRMLKDERSRDFVRNFTLQWLSIEKMKQVKINSQLFPRFLYYVGAGERRGTEVPYRPTIRDDMLEESVAFIAELIKRNASILSIVNSDFAMLNQRLAAHYGVANVQGHELRPVPIKPEHRLGGLLTQGSVLIANSTGSAPHPIYRAVWLREAILGEEVKEPPAEVPALSDSAGESAEIALSIKDLLAKHRQDESCNECHRQLDPWGIPFERYNAIGRYQPLVPKDGTRVRGVRHPYHGKETLSEYLSYLKTVNTEIVEADTRVPQGPNLDGMSDLKEHILAKRKEDVVENLIRRLLTYGLGRDLTYRDRYDVEELLEKSKKNEYKLLDTIISICQSKAFLGH